VPANSFVADGALLLLDDSETVFADQLIARAAGLIMEIATPDVTVGRSCATCGSTDHGQPLVVRPGMTVRECSVSFSRAAGHSCAAARLGAAIGVDIESVSAVGRHPVDDVLLASAEKLELAGLGSGGARYLAQLWVAKESITKLAGVGLRADLTELHVRLDGSAAELVSWPSGPSFDAAPRVTLFDVTDDIVGALAVLD